MRAKIKGKTFIRFILFISHGHDKIVAAGDTALPTNVDNHPAYLDPFTQIIAAGLRRVESKRLQELSH